MGFAYRTALQQAKGAGFNPCIKAPKHPALKGHASKACPSEHIF